MSNPQIDNEGNKYWYLNGKFHREDGPSVEYIDGTKYWHIEGKLHRIDGHAIENIIGDKLWYIEHKLHRMDGPAIEYSNGDKYWFYHGEQILCSSTEEFVRIIKLKAFW